MGARTDAALADMQAANIKQMNAHAAERAVLAAAMEKVHSDQRAMSARQNKEADTARTALQAELDAAIAADAADERANNGKPV